MRSGWTGKHGGMTTPMPPEPDQQHPNRMRGFVPAGLIVVVVVAIAAGGLFVFLRNRDEATAWPKSTQFRPRDGLGGAGTPAKDVDVDAHPGVYAFQDFQGWHLWIVNGEGVGPVTGEITSDKDFAGAETAIDDAGTVKASGSTITVDLPAEPELVGVDFNVGFFAQEVTFDLRGPDGPLDPDLVTVGRAHTADQMPFEIEKVPGVGEGRALTRTPGGVEAHRSS